MNEKISNTIALHQMSINELKEIKHRVETTESEDVRFRIETKHWYGYSEPFIAKNKDKLEISVYTMTLILDEAIKKEKERIEYFKKNQNFETQIIVDKDNNLKDGYTSYLIAKKYGIDFINVIKNS